MSSESTLDSQLSDSLKSYMSSVTTTTASKEALPQELLKCLDFVLADAAPRMGEGWQ